MLLDREAIPSMFETMLEDSAAGFCTGLIAFIVGAVVVSVHSQWNGTLAILISLFGLISLVEGILMLAFRKQFLGAFSFMTQSKMMISAFSMLAIVMGAAFIWAGLNGL